MSGAIQVTRGDELRLPFLLTAGGAIVNLGSGELICEVRVMSHLVHTLTVGSGLVIEQVAPNDERHGLIVLTEDQTADLAPGAINSIQLRFVTSAGRRVSSEPIQIEGLQP